MTSVVLVHGIAKQTSGPQSLLEHWLPAVRDGVTLARSGSAPSGRSGTVAADRALDHSAMVFYGDVFRPLGTRGLGEPPLGPEDVTDPLDQELLMAWWVEAARADPAVPGPEANTRLRTPYLVQRALHALSHARFFAGLADHLLIGALRQVRRYLTEEDVRSRVQERFASCLTADTRLVVAHSLGSVVAYEALQQTATARPALVTLGSPLGIPNVIFDRLRPPPDAGVGRWPAAVRTWVNIADRGDVVALVKTLAPRFAGDLTDVEVHNGTTAHDVRPYLTAWQTGAAIDAALRTE